MHRSGKVPICKNVLEEQEQKVWRIGEVGDPRLEKLWIFGEPVCILDPPRNLFAGTYSISPIKQRKRDLPPKVNLKGPKMSSLTYINEPGAGQKHSDLGHYSQAVVIGNVAKLSGQGGWDNDGNLDQYDWKQQIKNAFENVDRVLQAAGFRGWEAVSVAIVWYSLDSPDDIIGISPP
jgi:enamine deaminase RidA (YjgF/YER057c/UK114 family)